MNILITWKKEEKKNKHGLCIYDALVIFKHLPQNIFLFKKFIFGRSFIVILVIEPLPLKQLFYSNSFAMFVHFDLYLEFPHITAGVYILRTCSPNKQ